jgi:hypothetical protein
LTKTTFFFNRGYLYLHFFSNNARHSTPPPISRPVINLQDRLVSTVSELTALTHLPDGFLSSSATVSCRFETALVKSLRR